MNSTLCRQLLAAAFLSVSQRLDARPAAADPVPVPIDSAMKSLPVDTAAIAAQADSLPGAGRNRVFAGVAVGSITSRDEAGSPLTYRGIGFPFIVGYEYHGAPNRHRLLFSYRKTGINAPTMVSSRTVTRGTEEGTIAEHTVDYSLRRFSYNYSRILLEPDSGRFRLLGGILSDNILFFRYYSYAERPLYVRESSLGVWDGVLSLAPSVAVEYDPGDGSEIAAGVYAPLVALLFRPRYAIQDDELIKISFDNFSQLNSGRSRFVSLGDLLQVGGGLGYSRPVSDHVALRLEYSFLYSRIASPRVSATVENALAVTVEYRL